MVLHAPGGVISRATPDAAEALARLDARSFDAPWDADSYRTLLAGELTLAWRCDVAGRLAGALLVRCVAGEGEVLRLAVDPDARRRGHARALLAHACAALAPHLPYGLHLEVRASNDAAISLYRRMGFREVGRRPAYYVAPVEDAVLMHWERPAGTARPGQLAPAGSGW